MAITLVLYTRMGPYFSRSKIITTVENARSLVSQYGSGLKIVSSAGTGTYWFQDGVTLSIYASNTPGPEPIPTPDQYIKVYFRDTIGVYQQGKTYGFTPYKLRLFSNQYPNALFKNAWGAEVNDWQFDNYIDKTLYAELILYALKQPLDNEYNNSAYGTGYTQMDNMLGKFKSS